MTVSLTRASSRAPAVLVLGGLLVAGVAGPACEEQPPAAPERPRAVRPRADEPSRWWAEEGSPRVAVGEDEPAGRALAAAIAEARRTAGAARLRWLETPLEARDRWLVKWAAPRLEGGVEHVWVRPVTWSRFRVEGVLETAPEAPLQSGKVRHESVSFPIEELSDWLHYVDGDPEGTVEGGFTVRVLRARFGEPGEKS